MQHEVQVRRLHIAIVRRAAVTDSERVLRALGLLRHHGANGSNSHHNNTTGGSTPNSQQDRRRSRDRHVRASVADRELAVLLRELVAGWWVPHAFSEGEWAEATAALMAAERQSRVSRRRSSSVASSLTLLLPELEQAGSTVSASASNGSPDLASSTPTSTMLSLETVATATATGTTIQNTRQRSQPVRTQLRAPRLQTPSATTDDLPDLRTDAPAPPRRSRRFALRRLPRPQPPPPSGGLKRISSAMGARFAAGAMQAASGELVVPILLLLLLCAPGDQPLRGSGGDPRHGPTTAIALARCRVDATCAWAHALVVGRRSGRRGTGSAT